MKENKLLQSYVDLILQISYTDETRPTITVDDQTIVEVKQDDEAKQNCQRAAQYIDDLLKKK